MLLYHVSTDVRFNGDFEPRIPAVRIEGENNTVKRVCVSNTIEGCFSAMPNGGGNIETLQDETSGFYKLFIIDTKLCGIPDDAILFPDGLYQNNLVEDAALTGEHWITVPFKCSNQNVIFLKEWESQIEDVYPHEVERLMIEEDWDFESAFQKVCPERGVLVSITLVSEPEFFVDTIPSGESFYVDSDIFLQTELNLGDYQKLRYKGMGEYESIEDADLIELHDIVNGVVML